MELPEPKLDNWQRLYQPNAKAKCVKDDPPMKGFGRQIKAGEVLDVGSVCWENGKYTIGVSKECAFYDLEGYFEVVME